MAQKDTQNQPKQRQYLLNAWKNGRLSHAYVLAGPAGSGKLEFARRSAEELGAHPVYGLFVYGEEAGLSIEEARELSGKLRLKSIAPGYRVAVIAQAENMSVPAANSLLKTLEEPGEDTLIFLLTENFYKLLPTIISRVQRINFLGKQQERGHEVEEYLETLISGDVVERLQAAESLASKETPEIKSALTLLMRDWVRGGGPAKIGQKLMTAYSNLERSANPKLLLDNLFLR